MKTAKKENSFGEIFMPRSSLRHVFVQRTSRFRRFLPAFKNTMIEFTPDKSGEFTFACGMNMLRGKLIVEG